MSPRLACFSLALACIVLVLGACSKKPERIHHPGVSPTAAEAAMKQYDTDGNGKISGDELQKSPSLKSALKMIDKSGDDAITAAEITGRIEEWKESKLGVTTVSCEVTKDDKPVEGATVKFVPEKFLGESIQVAQGVTDENGMASISVPRGEKGPSGVAPGLYSVQITKEGEEIPGKFNTKTIYGVEVAADAEWENLSFPID